MCEKCLISIVYEENFCLCNICSENVLESIIYEQLFAQRCGNSHFQVEMSCNVLVDKNYASTWED